MPLLVCPVPVRRAPEKTHRALGGVSSPFSRYAQNDLTFLRIRSKKHEIMVAPGMTGYGLPEAGQWIVQSACEIVCTNSLPRKLRLPADWISRNAEPTWRWVLSF